MSVRSKVWHRNIIKYVHWGCVLQEELRWSGRQKLVEELGSKWIGDFIYSIWKYFCECQQNILLCIDRNRGIWTDVAFVYSG